jgi:hypothetical protein
MRRGASRARSRGAACHSVLGCDVTAIKGHRVGQDGPLRRGPTSPTAKVLTTRMTGLTGTRTISSSPLQPRAAPPWGAGSALDGPAPAPGTKTVVAVSYPISTRSKPRFATDSD